MVTHKNKSPETDTGLKLSANETLPRFGGKRDVARLIGVCPRSVDNFMRRGLPHLKLTPRKTRFDLAEVAAWFKAEFTRQRRG